MELVKPGETAVQVHCDWNIVDRGQGNIEVEMFVQYNNQTMASAVVKFRGDPKVLTVLATNIDLARKKMTSNIVIPPVNGRVPAAN